MPPQLDQAEVDAGWQPPVVDDRVEPRRGVPGGVKGLLVVLALVLVIVGIWALGGFKVRTDVRTPVAAGTLVKTGPYEFTFDDATVQQKKDYDDSIHWELIVRGSGRTTGDESISPSWGSNGMFIAKDPNTVERPTLESDTIGVGESFSGASDFTPGLAPVPYQLKFTFSEHFKPSDHVQFAVFELEFSNNHILDTDEKTWNNTRDAFVYELPVTVLPPDLDD